MKKVLHIITSLKTGGAEHLLVDLLPKLKELGNDVELLVFQGENTQFMQELQKKGIKIETLSLNGNVYNPINIFRLLKFFNGFDIIHTHLFACQLYVPIAKAFRLSCIPLVTTEHSTNNRRRGKWYLKMLDRWMYSRYKKVICISPSTRLNLESQIGTSINLINIENGVDIEKFRNPIKDISHNSEYIITMVARFFEAKDQDTLIKAMSILPKEYKLNLVGSGPRIDVVKKLIAELDLQDRICLLGVRKDIPNILSTSDIIVLSSHWEGLSLSSIEGMASGRPFIASDVDGLREIVDGYGILFPKGDFNSLAAKIQSLCMSPEKYQLIAKKCQQRAEQYDINIMAKKYNQLYESLN